MFLNIFNYIDHSVPVLIHTHIYIPTIHQLKGIAVDDLGKSQHRKVSPRIIFQRLSNETPSSCISRARGVSFSKHSFTLHYCVWVVYLIHTAQSNGYIFGYGNEKANIMFTSRDSKNVTRDVSQSEKTLSEVI
jgi:hypothetical protein